MTHLLYCSIDYHSAEVLCFDPEKVLLRLADAFPDAEIDWEDLSSKEVTWVYDYTASKNEMPDGRKEMMRRQITDKQRRNGPAYRFNLSDAVSGHVSRYSLVFKSDSPIPDDVGVPIREFMEALGAGTIKEGTAS